MDPNEAPLELPADVMRSMCDVATSRVLRHIAQAGDQHARGGVRGEEALAL